MQVAMTTGYAHSLYACSLAEFGQPRLLPHCEGWILERAIPGSGDRDGMGCYPLFACRDWSVLGDDVAELGSHLVSLVLVTDPFGVFDPVHLAVCFNRGVVPFKKHYVHDLSLPLEQSVSRHHRRNVRKALTQFHVEPVSATEYLDDWLRLYRCLVSRHGLQGIQAFSPAAFAKQLATPGLVAFRAVRGGETAGMLLWYVTEDVGYYHLGAFDDTGYGEGAAFALFWCSLVHFAPKLRWLCLGSVAGLHDDEEDGLARFKRGWSTGSRTAYLCRHVGDAARYAALTQRCLLNEPYFPAYRKSQDPLAGDRQEQVSHA
jgi:Acetyltransferase (GNAT) domain